jgi:hypothetical protein
METPHLDNGLFLISDLHSETGKCLTSYNLSTIMILWKNRSENQLIEEKLNYDFDELQGQSVD